MLCQHLQRVQNNVAHLVHSERGSKGLPAGASLLALCWGTQETLWHQLDGGAGWIGRDFKAHPVPAMGRDTFHYARLLQAPSKLARDTSRNGAAPALLESL